MEWGEKSIFYYLLMALLAIGVLQGLSIGFLFFFKKSGIKRANYLYGALLIAFAFTLFHNILTITGIFSAYPAIKFLPIYFTLALPPLLFYHVKIDLYPGYHFRWSDAKHFILPAGQLIFFSTVFFMATEYKANLGRYFYNPFFGGLEQFFYLTSFFAYLYFAYRYTKQKKRYIAGKKRIKRLLYLQNLLKVFFFLFCIHAGFVVSDFVSYEFLHINLRTIKAFAALGALSFANLVFWLGTYGFQVLFWGRKLFYS